MPNKFNYHHFILLIVLCVIFSNIAFSQGKEIITHESMWLMKRVGAPVPSPDGKWVVFSMTEPAYREKNNGSPPWELAKIWSEQNPARYAKNFKTPILVTVGENDFRVPMNNSIENWSILQRMKVPSRLIVFPEENHWILKGEDSRYFYSELLGWFKKWL